MQPNGTIFCRAKSKTLNLNIHLHKFFFFKKWGGKTLLFVYCNNKKRLDFSPLDGARCSLSSENDQHTPKTYLS